MNTNPTPDPNPKRKREVLEIADEPSPSKVDPIVKFDPPADLVDNSLKEPGIFPIHCLPKELRDYVEELARVLQVPTDLIAPMVPAVASAAIGIGLVLENPPRKTYANIFVLIAAPSGTGKSVTYRIVCAPLLEVQKMWCETFKATLPELNARRELLESERKKLIGKPKTADKDRLTEINKELQEIEAASKTPYLLAEDCTTQKIISLIAENNGPLSVISSEAGDVVDNLCGRWNESSESDDHIFRKGHSNEGGIVHRMGRDAVYFDISCLSMLLVSTPDTFLKITRGMRFLKGGFIARCLLVKSAARIPFDDGSKRELDKEKLAKWSALIHSLVTKYNRAVQSTTVLLSPDAERTYRDYGNELALRQDTLSEMEKSFASRLNEQAKRVGLILHALQYGVDAGSHPLSGDTSNHAVEIVRWFESHQALLLAESIRAEASQRFEKLSEKIRNRGTVTPEGHTMTLRDLKRASWKEAEIRELANKFKDQLRLVDSTPGPDGGRISAQVLLLKPNN